MLHGLVIDVIAMFPFLSSFVFFSHPTDVIVYLALRDLFPVYLISQSIDIISV